MIASLLVLAAVPAVVHLAVLGRILFSRLDYSYDAHWLDGGSLLHAHRLLEGRPIYPEPSLNAGFVPFPYPPFLYLLLAAAGKVVGLDYATGRIISLTAMTAGAAILAHEVYVRFRDLFLPWVWALLTLGTIAAAFPFTGAWYDAAMTDPLALGLAIASGRVLLGDSDKLGMARLALASGLMLLTIFTKQTYAVLVAWQVLFLYLSDARRGIALGLAAAASTAITLAIAQRLTHGHFLTYVAGNMLRHGADPRFIWKGLGVVSSFAPYWPLVVIGAVFLVLKRALSASSLLWTGMLAAAFPAALLPYAKWGGFENVFLPIVVLGPAAALCVLGDLCRWLRPDRRAFVLVPCALVTAFYHVVRRYAPEPYLANEQRHAAADKLNDFVAGLGPDVLIPSRPFLAVRNGTRIEQIHVGGWYDVLVTATKVTFDDFIRKVRPRYVLLSDQEPAVIVEALAKDYVLRGPLPPETWPAQTLDTVAVQNDPYPGQLLWVVERNPAEPPSAHCLFEFESSAYDGWKSRGNAFASGPMPVEAQRWTKLFAKEGTVLGVVGSSFASSASGKQASAATGILRSPLFTLDRDNVELRVAGGTTTRTRVELRVGGRVRYRASGRGNNYLEQVRWNVAKDRGRSAQLFLIDRDPTSQILVDHVCLVDGP